MLGDRALACDVSQQLVVLPDRQNQEVGEYIVIKRRAVEEEVCDLVWGVVLVPRCHDELRIGQFGVDLHIGVVNGVVPSGAIVANANSVTASQAHKCEAECILVIGGYLGIVVDDENDEIRAVKQRTIKGVRWSQANVENVLTTRAG